MTSAGRLRPPVPVALNRDMQSRIPSAGSYRPVVSRTSIPVASSSASALGKRPATDAGLDSDIAATQKELIHARSQLLSSERRALRAERNESELRQQLEEQRVRIDQLTAERNVLLDGETQEKDRARDNEAKWDSERIRELRQANSQLSTSLAEEQSLNASLTMQHANLARESKSTITTLESRLVELERDNGELRNWERRAAALSIELEEQKRRALESARKRDDVASDLRTDEKIRDEFRRQSQNFRDWQQTQGVLQVELADLRRWKKDAEAAERAAKEVERALRDEITALHIQLERARHDVDFSSSSSSGSPDAAALQARLATLTKLHNEASDEIAAQQVENDKLHARLTALAMDSRSAILEATRRAEEAERELRWAKEGRKSAELREELTRAELNALQESMAQVDQSARVRELEGVLALYKKQLDDVARDSRDIEDRLTRGAGLVKSTELDEANARIDSLQRDVESLQASIAELTSANTTLHAEVSDLMQRLASGEFNPAVERCVELRANPAAKIHAIRQAMLDELRAENTALLDRLAQVDRTSASEGLGAVPRESFDRLVKEKEAMEAAHAKRLQRLKEIFGSKSREFLESVYSLLGWRIKFDESGADVRLTSMYAPKGKMGLTLKFASQEGHFGTMQMSGGMARGLEEARHFWVVERQSIPGFLAQVTTEMFEKTTVGDHLLASVRSER